MYVFGVASLAALGVAIVSGFAIASLVVLVLTVVLALLLTSPDVPSATVQSWSKTEPADFLATAATELNDTSGTVDTDLLAQRDFYGTNFTKPLLFMGDGAYFSGKATAMNLSGDQWGVMNTLWYYVPGFSASANVDLIAVYLTGLATILLLAIPFIPGLRNIPRWIPVHRLIWRDWEPAHPDTGSRPSPAVATPAAPPPLAEPPNPT